MTIIETLAEELAMTMHISVAGPLYEQGWSDDVVVAAIKRCAELMPECEQVAQEL